jgi:chlorite dismutase
MHDPNVHGFLYFRIPGGYRTSQEAERVRQALEAAAATTNVAGVYAYSLVGLRADADVGFWIATAGVEAYQAAARRFLRTNLELTASLWGSVRPSPYTGRSGTSVRVPGQRLRYLVVYPFTKTHEWYQLAAEERRAIMLDHARVGHRFEGIEQLLLYCIGIADWEFVVGYETDDLERFSDLVAALRSTAARPYTLRDTPAFTGRYGTIDEVLDEAFGLGN